MRRALFLAVCAIAAAGAGCAAVLGLSAGEPLDPLPGPEADGALDRNDAPDSGAVTGDEGGISCSDGTRLCGTSCAKNDDPGYGCGAVSCAPCSGGHASHFACESGKCAVAQNGCDPGWADCNHSGADGCEADLNSAATCGSCTNACSADAGSADAGSPFCWSPQCVGSCAPLHTCGSSCVNTSSDPLHCGTCANDCTRPNSQPSCASGICSFTCYPGWGDCDTIPTNGCEAPLNTDVHCGSCTNDCTASNPPHTFRSCQGGSTCSPLSCDPGWQDCDNNLSNGCECSGAGCCSSGLDAKASDSPVCLPPGAGCNAAASTCCGSCTPGTMDPPRQPPNAQPGTCCSTLAQPCPHGQSDCCTGRTCTLSGVCQ